MDIPKNLGGLLGLLLVYLMRKVREKCVLDVKFYKKILCTRKCLCFNKRDVNIVINVSYD